MNLLEVADLQTWNSPRAEACRNQLSAQIAAVGQATDELAQFTRRLEEQALELEYAIAQQAAVLNPANKELR